MTVRWRATGRVVVLLYLAAAQALRSDASRPGNARHSLRRHLGKAEREAEGTGPGQPGAEPAAIPHILHQVLLSPGPAAPGAAPSAPASPQEAAEAAAGAAAKAAKDEYWRATCRQQHATWRHMWWDDAAGEALLAEHYPWFLPTYRAYPKAVHRADALRVFVLHRYGGLYLDGDVECIAPSDAMLAGFHLVLQLEDGSAKSLNNGVMASVPAMPFWPAVMALLQQRAGRLGEMHAAAEGAHTRKAMSEITLTSTGPWMLRDAFAAYLGSRIPQRFDVWSNWRGTHAHHGYLLRVYGLGAWYNPCSWTDSECHARVERQIAAHEAIPGIVGHHKFSGTWLKGIAGAAEPPRRSHTGAALAGLGCMAVAALGYAVLRRRGSVGLADVVRGAGRSRGLCQRG